MRKRIVLVLILLLVLGTVVAAVWQLADWPPPGMLLRYGLTPGCEPTGKTRWIEGVEFVEIGPGCFRMGSTHLAEGGDFLGKVCAAVGLPWGDQPEPSDETPVHWVEFRRGFWIARTEITNEQHDKFDSKRGRSSYSADDRAPVAGVSWGDAKRFCSWMAERSGVPVRLPSESEWECACRAGSRGEYSFGDDDQALPDHAWFEANSVGTSEVGELRPNSWGLFDLDGNLSEWCEDMWHCTYEGAPTDGSAWIEGGEVWEGAPYRVFRGGSWNLPAEDCRAASRDATHPDDVHWRHGFRPAFTSPDD